MLEMLGINVKNRRNNIVFVQAKLMLWKKVISDKGTDEKVLVSNRIVFVSVSVGRRSNYR